MTKPKDHFGYESARTESCRQLLITLFRKLGPWKDMIVLVGGLVPSLRFQDKGHVGTTDIDLVLNIDAFEDVEAYKTLEKNLKNIGLKRGTNAEGNVQHFTWILSDEEGTEKASLDLLCPTTDDQGGRVVPLRESGEKRLSAFGIPGARLVFQDNDEMELRGELLDGDGKTRVKVKVVGLVSFVVLKALAFKERGERKDAYDLIFTLRECEEGPEALGAEFAQKMKLNPEETLFKKTLAILKDSFLDEDGIEGFEKEGPAHYGNFVSPTDAEERSIARRDAVAIVEAFFRGIHGTDT